MIPLSCWPAAETDETRPVAFGREGTRTASDLRRDVARLVARASDAAGGCVLLHCDDAYAFAVGLLAAARLGARALLPPSRQPGALAPLVGEVCGAILDGDASTVPEGLRHWHPLDPDAGPDTGVADPPPLDPAPLARDAELAVLFTSGTTGAGRRVGKAVRHLEDEVAVLEARFGERLGPGTPVLATVAPQHLYGLLFRVLWPLSAGRPFLRSAVLHPEELAPHAEAADTFALATAPATLRHLVARGELARRRDACRAIFSSGGPLSAGVAQGALAATGEAPFEVYGSTETGGVAVRQQFAGGEAWRPMQGVSLEIDRDSGCLAVVSPFVSVGVSRDDGRTRFVTGDRATLAADGSFTLAGRADRVVKVGEKRLSLPDMEQCLQRHEAVAEATLLAIEVGAETRVGAVVAPSAPAWDLVASTGRRALAKTLTEHLAPDFERVLLPRAWRFVSALPRDSQGKLPTPLLRGLFERESPVAEPERLAERREADALERRLRIPWDLAFLDGHFPGRPVVPGVAQVHFALRALGDLLGETDVPATLGRLKFHEVLLPGDEVVLRVERIEIGRRFRFSLEDAARPGRLFAGGDGSLERGS